MPNHNQNAIFLEIREGFNLNETKLYKVNIYFNQN